MIFCSGFCQSVMVLSVGDFLLWDMAIDLVNDMEREREVGFLLFFDKRN